MAKDGSTAIPELAGLLKDPDFKVRDEAVRGIVEIGGPRSIDPLITAAADNDDRIQIRAVDGLVNVYMPGYVAVGFTANLKRAGTNIKQRFTDRNDQTVDPYVILRPEVVQAIGRLVSGGSSMESRANAARAIGILRGRAALDELYRALRSKDSDVLYESLVAIQKIRDPEAGPHTQFLLRDLNERVQVAAVEAAGLLGNRAAVPELESLYSTSGKIKVRRAALSALAMLPAPEQKALFTKAMAGKDEALRTSAAEGLGRLRNPADLPLLERAYGEETKRAPQLALAFAMVLDGRTDVAANSPLTVLAQNLGSAGYRGVVGPYLSELAQNAEVRLQLYGLLERGTKDEKMGLAQILGATGDPQAAPHLEKISRDADPQIAQEALRALKNLRAAR